MFLSHVPRSRCAHGAPFAKGDPTDELDRNDRPGLGDRSITASGSSAFIVRSLGAILLGGALLAACSGTTGGGDGGGGEG